MAPHHVARLRLFALCVALGCQAAAFAAVSQQTLKLLQTGNVDAYRPGTLAAWLGLCSVPALILSPLSGVLAGSRWNRAVLLGTSALVVAALGFGYVRPDLPWLSVAGLLALNLAFFGTAAVALVGSIGREAEVRPTATSLGIAFGLVGGVAAGVLVAWLIGPNTLPPTAALMLGGPALAAFYIAWYVRNRLGDPVSLGQGIVRPFLEGTREALRHRRARYALVGLWLWFFVALAAVVALVRIDGPAVEAARQADRPELSIFVPPSGAHVLTMRFFLAAAAGILVSALNRHPYRHAGFVLYAALIMAASVLCLRFWDTGIGPLTGLGFGLGLALSPLLSFYFIWSNPRNHGVAAALVVAGWSAGAGALAAVLTNLGDDPAAARTPLLNVLLGVTGLAFVAGFAAFFRPAMELALEVLFGPVYRIRGFGPGLDHMPTRGPYLVIGNHAAYFDPLYFAKIVPPPIVPMMTSKFYDLPVISWLMRHVIGTIRVPDKPIRHEAPELKEAVAALDRGECVVLFPEGYLRRKEEVPLRRFGRGVWQILKDRPQTPVFACWIEGSWGTFFSFRGGPPTKGKWPGFWRRIRIGVQGPITVDAATLADHMATRTFLMQQVSEARRPLGLDPLALPAAHDGEGDKE